MKILFVIENYLPHVGGVEIVFKNLAEGLVKKGHSVTIVTHKLPGTPERQELGGVDIVRVPCLDSRYLFTFAAIPAAIRQARDADIVHTTTYNGAFPAWIGARLQKKPVIITVHETWMGRWGEFTSLSPLRAMMHECLEWCVYRIPRFDRYAGVSHATARRLRDAFPDLRKRIVAIPNGFDAGMWKKPRKKAAAQLRKDLGLEKRFVILAGGRPGASKGFEYLIDAFPLVKKRIPEAVLLLMLSRERQYAHKVDEFRARAPDGVVFLDPVRYDELPAWRQMADCIVIPSLNEGFGYVVLESAATGTPIVATDVGSIPEVVWGKHVLVKSKSASALAQGIVRARRGKYRKTKEKRFPWSSAVAGYERIYERLVR